jgi:hypothetical protein
MKKNPIDYRWFEEQSLYILFLENKPEIIRKSRTFLFIDEPGATRISCFFVRNRKKTSSFVGSISRIVEQDLSDKDFINAEYCCVKDTSIFERIGIPKFEE